MRAHRRPYRWRAALAGILVLAAGSLAARAAQVQGTSNPPKPARKDSPTRARPKDAVFSTSIEPAEAKPGDTVHFKVKVKLSPGYHIYTQAETQEGDGPRRTVFDLFDKGGLKVSGGWKASKKPESHAEPAFENQVFEYFEDEVTWSIPLKVPPGASAGKSVIRCQASYQICSAQNCSFPGRWTLPNATLTILAADAGSGSSEGSGSPTLRHDVQRPQSVPAPAKRDSSSRIRPRGVTLSPSVEPAEARPGDVVTYKVLARLEPGLHIYATAKEGEPREGPIPTTFDFFDPAGLSIQGPWKSDHPPEAKAEPAFNNQLIEFFEHEVTWSIALEVPADAAPGQRILRCQAGYQVCNENSCFPPGRWTLPDVTLNVVTAFSATTPTVSSASSAGPSSPTGSASRADPDGPHSGPYQSAPAPSAPLAAPSSEVAKEAEKGLIPFLIFSAIGGLYALLMPCVWPMIPITVNFFVKQGQDGKSKGTATRLAVAYCLAIIAVFTTVGVLFSFFFSSSFLQNLANNPWLNLLVAALFLAFGLSLLGLFEIRLPTFLLNASARGENRGGLVGVVFMALTLTITSFTCTFPVVGGLLVIAAGGKFLYPVIGLATFATVLALPFFLLALSPGLIAKMPRSGDWMNAAKVVGGLVEIGAALKFLNTAELGYVTPEDAWFDASVVLTAWIALAAVCGFYLLGFFRTDHDYDVVKVGPGRLVFGSLFLALALYMTPALFGRPPQSFVWERLIVGILPPDASEFARAGALTRGATNETGPASLAEVRASSKDPAQAQREEKKLHGVLWGMSFDQAKELASATKKPILIDFTGVNCTNCRLMEQRVLPRPEVVKLLKDFVTIQLYTDFVQIASITAEERRELATKNQELQLDLTQEATNPFYVVLTPEGKLVSALGGYNEPTKFVLFLKSSLEKARGGMSVAQAVPQP
jgi:thiol:disulfide interchange protein DsbD